MSREGGDSVPFSHGVDSAAESLLIGAEHSIFCEAVSNTLISFLGCLLSLVANFMDIHNLSIGASTSMSKYPFYFEFRCICIGCMLKILSCRGLLIGIFVFA